MEAHSYSLSSSNSFYHQNESNKPNNPPTILNSSLHSVRKPLAKPWKKPMIAPLPQTPLKIYKVDSAHFREVVQRLTGAPPETHQSRRLHSIAFTPTKVSTPGLSDCRKMASPLTIGEVMVTEIENMKTWRLPDSIPAVGPLGISLSPSSRALQSPGTVSSLEQSTVI